MPLTLYAGGYQQTPAFDPATLAWINAVVTNGGTVSDARRRTVDNIIRGLKASTIFTKLDRLWLFDAENTQSALTDLIHAAQASPINAPTFTVDRGYKGNGTSSYIDTNYNPTISGVNFTATSACLGAWVNDSRPTQNDNGSIGSNDVSGSFIIPNFNVGATGFTWAIIDNATMQVSAVANAQGFGLISRTGANAEAAYKNGVQIDSQTGAAGTLPNVTLSVCAINSNPVGNFNGSDTISCAVIGGGLTAAEALSLYNQLRTYMTAVGVP